MENFLNSLPKPVLVFFALAVGVILIFLLKPPHTICDTQEDNIQTLMKGILYPSKVGKRTLPAKIAIAKETCFQGVSSGACYEYFSILRSLAKEVIKAPNECADEIYNMTEVKTTLNEGIERMAIVAWGEQPPEPGAARFGWLQESELLLFCLLRDAFMRSQGNESWNEFRKAIYKKLPGEPLVVPKDPNQAVAERLKAPDKMSENEIWNRSLFSIRCENYR